LIAARTRRFRCARDMTGGRGQTVDEAQMQARLDLLRQEHRDLDVAIAALAATGVPDQLQIARLKKRKLRLRDEAAMIEDTLIPDIIA
jgi:hypothetical protein